MTTVQTYLIVRGELHGDIWMPSTHASKQVNARVEIVRGERYTYSDQAPSVRSALNDLLNDGDFQACKLTPDTLVEVVRKWSDTTGAHSHARQIDTERLGKDYVAECDGHDYGEDY